MRYTCPNCKSILEIDTKLDFTAPALQILECPVCQYPIYKPSGIISTSYSIKSVIEKHEPILAWKEIQELQPAAKKQFEAEHPIIEQPALWPELVSGIKSDITGAGSNMTKWLLIIGAIILVVYLFKK